MSPAEKLEKLRKKVASLSNQDKHSAAESCIGLWEEIVCPELTADELTLIQPQLKALKTFVGTRH